MLRNEENNIYLDKLYMQTWKWPFVKNTENAQKSWKTAWNQGKIAQIGLKIKESV